MNVNRRYPLAAYQLRFLGVVALVCSISFSLATSLLGIFGVTSGNSFASDLPKGDALTSLNFRERKFGQSLTHRAVLDVLQARDGYRQFFSPRSGIHHDVVVAVIDSGVDLTHRELKRHLWINHEEIPANGIDDDGNGYIDDVNGYNFASQTANPGFEKSSLNEGWQYAHGTKVAGLITKFFHQVSDASSLVSSNPMDDQGHFLKLMVLNNMGRTAVMDQSDTAQAIRYAVRNGASVINLSLGGTVSAGPEYRAALRYAVENSVLVIAASGNENMEIGSDYSVAGTAAEIPGVISVGNIRAADRVKSVTSNYGPEIVKLGAPGTFTQGEGLLTTAPGDKYEFFSGTSAATPVVSAAAALTVALIKSRGYSYSARDIESLLLDSADRIPALARFFQEGRVLNLGQLARLVNLRFPERSLQQVASGVSPSTAF